MTRAQVDPHDASADLAAMSVSTLGAGFADGSISSRQVTSALLDRIAAIDAPGTPIGLRSVLLTSDDAVEQAAERDRRREAGGARGPLHGVPILVKDNIEAHGLPGSAGSLALADRAVTRDAPLVARLREAGAVILGATNLSEWANFRSPRSVSGWSAMGGLTGNPWACDRSAGGSSSGSGAAVSAGLAPVAIGTETNGSITCPAALNGVVGLKPTVGSVPTAGVVPISASQDSPGPFGRSVRDVALVYEVMSARNDCIASCESESAKELRVGVVEAWLTGDGRTDAAFERAASLLGPRVAAMQAVGVPAIDDEVGDDQVAVLVGELVDDLGAYLDGRPGVGVRSLADVVAFNLAHADSELSAFGQEYFERAVTDGGRSAVAYREARARNVTWARDLCLGPAIARGVDVLIAPAYRPAWKSDLTHGDVLMGGGSVCTPPAILGWPILTVPMGFVDELPVGVSIVGPPHSEPHLLAVGRALETALGLVASGALRPTWKAPARG
jgi:amidase